ncbi:phospholipid/glycerol acyltransferase [Providencia sneebia]|uniref:Phospholipid/glycerol acyltransferase n=1 Tax=Providencia sneebia DSM 19967 TaxID=1141660 RepID=K8WV20_9GAMM|nr:phospholipid/glycerol acyltransferase [Providencia sneebia]EKT60040.1 phospholipid/glycerol acyltransferase [Providencia sneebia DSM 19967]
MSQDSKTAIVAAGQPLSTYYQRISSIIRQIYYPYCTLVGHLPILSNGKPTLFLCSHRNSAFDGYLSLKVAPLGQSLASIQLLNSPLMRLYFTGIPVVRKKDKERLGIKSSTFDDPVEAGMAHITKGGDLFLFPEGSSEWGYKPLPYQRGGARIIRLLLEQQVEFNVIPVGLFYTMPDRFASYAEIYVGAPLSITNKNSDETDREWEKRIFHQISQSLDEVSVNCPDEKTFEEAQQYAYQSFMNGESYAQAFLRYQQQPEMYQEIQPKTKSQLNSLAWRWLGFCLMFIFLPIFLASAIAARFADARNTVSFFKIFAGGLAALIWLPFLIVCAFLWPSVIITSLISAFIGYKIIQYKGSVPC